MRKLASSFAVVLAASAGTVAGFATAAYAAVPPSCVTAATWSAPLRHGVTVTNNCSSSQRFKILWDYAADGDCKSLQGGGWRRDEWRVAQATFRGLQSC